MQSSLQSHGYEYSNASLFEGDLVLYHFDYRKRDGSSSVSLFTIFYKAFYINLLYLFYIYIYLFIFIYVFYKAANVVYLRRLSSLLYHPGVTCPLIAGCSGH